jgi:Rieske Fe-S protein
MAEQRNTTDDPRATLDPQINSPEREGLTGTTPATIYKPIDDPEQVTTAPDGRPMDQQPAWRKDFPVDVPQDNYVARREFMKFLALTSVAFTVGQAVIAGKSLLRPQKTSPGEKRIALINDIPIGGTIAFAYPGGNDPCVLTRIDEKTLLAYSQKCTHLSCAVVPVPKENVIHCPCHNGYFDLATGRPLAGPPRRPLPKITLEVRGEEIYAVGIERSTV